MNSPSPRFLVLLLTLSVAATVAACGGRDGARNGAATAGAQDTLPLPAERLIALAAEAEARLDAASRVRSGLRLCGAGTGQPSSACELELTVRFDTDSFPMDRIPGGFVVLAVVRNLGDSTESRTGIPARTTAYALVQQGGPQRANAWYFSIDQAERRANFIKRVEARVCPQPHADAGQLRAAFRFCPPTAAAITADSTGGPPPVWYACQTMCCIVDT